MLYDPKWEKQAETKADPLTLEALIAWLERQPSTARYYSTDAKNCLLAQWLKSMDPGAYVGSGHSFNYVFHGRETDMGQFRDVVFDQTKSGLYTFGDALARARTVAAIP